jgi:hypothetical protein
MPNMLTKDEVDCINALLKAWNLFIQLKPEHPKDAEEFMRAIHAAENIVLARPMVRYLGKDHAR